MIALSLLVLTPAAAVPLCAAAASTPVSGPQAGPLREGRCRVGALAWVVETTCSMRQRPGRPSTAQADASSMGRRALTRIAHIIVVFAVAACLLLLLIYLAQVAFQRRI